MSFVLLSLAIIALCSATKTRVRFDVISLTNNATGSFTVETDSTWAPLGVKRFLELVDDGFWSQTGMFRCVPNFVVQWGISGNPQLAAKWVKRTIKDDPVVASNVVKTISFATAGPNTRTTQLFVNLVNNKRLDGMGFSPFATVVDGWDVVQKIYMGYGEAPSQDLITSQGNAYLLKNFPKLTFITAATRV
jgi:peptidyl-prolyl cis-trans isomerase A (cyclophilin A)